jgi:hypothetical protein
LKQRLLDVLNEQGQQFLADAVQHSEIEEAPGEVRFAAPREFTLSLRSPELRAVVVKLLGRAVRIVPVTTDTSPLESPPQAGPPAVSDDDELSRRALSHPEVQRFQSMFPGSHVRTVRNLKQ